MNGLATAYRNKNYIPKQGLPKLDFLSAIIGFISEFTLLGMALLVGTFGGILSLFELIRGNYLVLLAYCETLALLFIHYLIRSAYPEKFIAVSFYKLPPKNKREKLRDDFFFRFMVSAAASFTAVNLLFPGKIMFFADVVYPLAQKISYLTLIYSVLFVIYLIFVAYLIKSIIIFLISDVKPQAALFLGLTVAMLVLGIYSLYLDVTDSEPFFTPMVEYISSFEEIEQLISFILGIPLLFWLRFLLLGGNLTTLK